MRSVTGIIFFLCCVNFSSAQTNVYHPFPDSGIVWNMSIMGSNECLSCYRRSYFINEDTVVNGVSCHKVFYRQNAGITVPPWGSCSYPWSIYSNPIYGGALYDDTILKKVYLFLPGSSTDTLLYDFSLSVGDTLEYGMNNTWNFNIYVDSIDSIQIGNSYRKRLRLGNTVNVDLIEGIGSTTGLLEDLWVFECGGYLDCVSQNGQTIYPYSNYPCDLMDDVNEFPRDASELNLSVFPNPITDQLTVNSKHLLIDQIEIYNSIGERRYSSDVHSASCPPSHNGYGGQCIVHCASFSPGIYFVKATAGDKIFYKKIIKE